MFCRQRQIALEEQQFRNYKVVYRRYAGLFFCVCVDANDNELAHLESIHLFVEVLGKCRFYHPLEETGMICEQMHSLRMFVS